MEAHLIALVCGLPPEGYGQWKLQLLAEKIIDLEVIDSILATVVGTTLKKNELHPFREKMWVIPPKQNADFVCKMEEVLSMYECEYDVQRPLVCLDESPKQLLESKHWISYIRHGVRDIYMAFEPLAGHRQCFVEENHN